jgi:ferredoxin
LHDAARNVRDGSQFRSTDGSVMVEVWVDEDACIGSRNCAFLRPDLFQITDEGIAQLQAVGEPLDGDEIVTVARNCPSHAINVTIDGQHVAGGEWMPDR